MRSRSQGAPPLPCGARPALDAVVLLDPDEPQINHLRWVPTRWRLSDYPEYLATAA